MIFGCHHIFMLATVCDLFLLGLLSLRSGSLMFKDILGRAIINRDRVLIAAELSVLWQLMSIAMYIGKRELWKYAFVGSIFLKCFALLGYRSTQQNSA